MAPENQQHLRPRNHPLLLNAQGRCGITNIISICRRDGLFISIELKSGRDKLRPEQNQFLNKLKATGGLAFVAQSYAQFQQSFERRGFT